MASFRWEDVEPQGARGGTSGCEGWDVRIAGTGVGLQDARDGMYGYLVQG